MDFVVDLSLVMQHVLYLEKVSLDHIDEIFAMKACKASIKAGEELNYLQMQELVEDGFAHIDGMFVLSSDGKAVLYPDIRQKTGGWADGYIYCNYFIIRKTAKQAVFCILII